MLGFLNGDNFFAAAPVVSRQFQCRYQQCFDFGQRQRVKYGSRGPWKLLPAVKKPRRLGSAAIIVPNSLLVAIEARQLRNKGLGRHEKSGLSLEGFESAPSSGDASGRAGGGSATTLGSVNARFFQALVRASRDRCNSPPTVVQRRLTCLAEISS